jgi:hypothetical protein
MILRAGAPGPTGPDGRLERCSRTLSYANEARSERRGMHPVILSPDRAGPRLAK